MPLGDSMKVSQQIVPAIANDSNSAWTTAQDMGTFGVFLGERETWTIRADRLWGLRILSLIHKHEAMHVSTACLRHVA